MPNNIVLSLVLLNILHVQLAGCITKMMELLNLFHTYLLFLETDFVKTYMNLQESLIYLYCIGFLCIYSAILLIAKGLILCHDQIFMLTSFLLLVLPRQY